MNPEGLALVTGASRGIGRATALELAVRGFEVVATMREVEAGRALEAEAQRAGGRLSVQALDVRSPDSISIPDGLRVLINNAGIEGENHSIEDTPLEVWREIFETNVFGLLEVTRRAIPKLRASGGGVVCNVTSCSILVPMPFFGVYRASKATVSAMGESLRAELGPQGIRVVEIMPGAIETDMLAASQLLPEAATSPVYAAQARLVSESRALASGLTTPAPVAARAIVDAILDDAGPMRYGCDPMSEGLLARSRTQSDEESMAPMVSLFDPSKPR